MDRFDNLPKLKENIENKLKKPPAKLEKENLDKINSMNLFEDSLNKAIENMNNNSSNICNEIKGKQNEISKNFEIFLNKLETETNNHLKSIENLNLSEEQKKEEYIKCLEELDKIYILTQALENHVEIAEENFLNFLDKPFDFEKDFISEFLIKNEEDLKKNIMLDKLLENDQYLEKIYNDSQISYLRNYITQTRLLKEPYFKLNQLKINENSDISDAKEILITLSNDNEIIQNEIKNISLANLSKEKINFLFTKNKNIKKKAPPIQSNKNVNFNINKTLTNEDLRSRKQSEEPQVINSKENKEQSYFEIVHNYDYMKLKNCDCSEIKLNETLPNLNKLKAYSCKLYFDFSSEKILRKLNEIDAKELKDFIFFNNLTELYLENCDIVNENFQELYFLITKIEAIRNNLKLISFKNNKITVVFVNAYFNISNGVDKLANLEFFDLSNNNINEINFSNLFQNLPNLKVLDFSNNNIYMLSEELLEVQKSIIKEKSDKKSNQINKEEPNSEGNIKSEKEEEKKKEESEIKLEELIYLMAGNIIINKDNELENYIRNLIYSFSKNDYPLKSFNFSGMFHKEKFHQYLYKMDLLKFKNSLIEIDLSLCNLTNIEVSNILKKEFLIKNLKKINLANNNLTDDFFKILTENELHEIFDQLREIDLTNNEIYLNRTKEVINFVNSFDSLKKIIICDTPAEEIINDYIKKKIIRFNEEQNNKKIETKFNKDELLIKELLENKGKNNDNFGNQNSIRLYMNNCIDFRFVEATKKLCPDLFDKIDIKCKNNYFG